MFTDRFARPLLDSPAIGMTVSALLAAWVLVLGWLSLRGPLDRLRWWHVLACVVLLLPVSHVAYTVFLLPMLWVWTARALVRRGTAALVTSGLLVWWLLARFSWLDEDGSWWHNAVVPIANLAAVSLSVLVVSRVTPHGPTTQRPHLAHAVARS